MSESLGLSERGQMVVGGAVLLIVVALIGVIWTSETPSEADPDLAPRTQLSTPAPATSSAAPAPAAEAAPAAAARDTAPPMPPVPDVVTHDPDTPVDPGLDQQREQAVTQVTRTPRDGAAHNRLALVLAQMGQNDEALKEFNLAIAAAPREAAFRINFANLALANHDWSHAIDQYREAVLLNRTDFPAQLGLAVAMQRKGDHQLAVAEFLKARHLNADAPLVAMGLGASYEQLGRRADATREYREFVRLQPGSREAERVNVYLATLR